MRERGGSGGAGSPVADVVGRVGDLVLALGEKVVTADVGVVLGRITILVRLAPRIERHAAAAGDLDIGTLPTFNATGRRGDQRLQALGGRGIVADVDAIRGTETTGMAIDHGMKRGWREKQE